MSYIKLDHTPVLVLNYSDCSSCLVSVESDGDGWICPSCGTGWAYGDEDGDEGTLYEEWSGEDLEGPTYSEDDLWFGRHLK